MSQPQSQSSPNNKEQEQKIIKGWARVTQEYQMGQLNEYEQAQIERAQLAEEQAKRTKFILGLPINQPT